MSYESFSLLCKNHKHGEMEYEGEGNYVCSVCGFSYHDDEYDEDYDDEKLSIWDAAAIWRSRGKDEDYMFGYTEDELENA